jgi:hypothetical protein
MDEHCDLILPGISRASIEFPEKAKVPRRLLSTGHILLDLDNPSNYPGLTLVTAADGVVNEGNNQYPRNNNKNIHA